MADNGQYYLAAQVRELDRVAIEDYGIPGFTLMQRAGKAAFHALLSEWPDTSTVLCFCGSGNNGGDGYVVAALAIQQGLRSHVIAVGDTAKLQGDARRAYDLACDLGVATTAYHDAADKLDAFISPGTVIVDAMLGTGLTGDVRGDYADAIAFINTAGCPVLAADIPSGLCSDTGRLLGSAVKADLTVTFIGRKLGQVRAEGPATCGKLVFDDLGAPPAIYTGIPTAAP